MSQPNLLDMFCACFGSTILYTFEPSSKMLISTWLAITGQKRWTHITTTFYGITSTHQKKKMSLVVIFL